jgi:chromosome segregation ATPase
VKQQNIITVALVAALVVLSIFIFRSCRADERLRKAKLDYAEYRQTVETENELMSNRLDELNKAIGQKDEVIGQLEQEVTGYVEKLRHTTQELTDLQNAEPPTTPEIESMPIVINLRGQVAKLTEMFTLSTAALTLQTERADALVGQVKLWEEVSAEWKAAYEREHTLRVQSEGLFKMAEQRIKMNKFWKTTTAVATGVAAGILLIK